MVIFFFFFQAEDGIRDVAVTGVQTCALPISMKLFEAQSQELDPKKRLALNVAIQKKLEADAARPILDWKIDFFTVWPHVKNLIPHQSIYNFGRMQEVWSDK